MRAWIAAVLGGIAGAAATLVVIKLPPDAPAPLLDDHSKLERAIEAIQRRLDGREALEHAGGGGLTPVSPVAEPVTEQPGVPESNGRHGRQVAPAAPETPADLSKVSSEDLALEADDRHTNNFDISGAIKRYRELLSRASTPAHRRHCSIRLGDCYVRLHMDEEALRAYRDCVDASTEDHPERVACMITLARHEMATNAAEASRWIERALALETGRANETVHRLAADIARQQHDDAREIREIQWLIENVPHETGLGNRLAELRGQKR